MKFRINWSDDISMNKSLVYRPHEFSFDTTPQPQASLTSLLLDDLNLEVDENGKIVSVWGVCPHTRWEKTKLRPPKAKCGNLFVVPKSPFQRSVGFRLNDRGNYLPTLVDVENGWVKVVCNENPASAVLIMPGVVVEICQDDQLCALWLNPHSGIDAETLKSR